MEDDQQQFDKDDFTGLDGQNGENFEQQENQEQTAQDGGDQAMETGGDAEEENEDDRKIFVGGLSWETSAKQLREYCEKFGEVTNCTLKTDFDSGRSRGFGFVIFKESATVDAVLKIKEHKLQGRKIDPKPANPRKGMRKIFVGKLDPSVPEEDVKTYFTKFGKVVNVELPYDKVKEQRRAFCFVEFDSDKTVKKILDQTSHKIGGQEVDVKKATPNPAQAGSRGGRGGWGAGRGGRGGMRGRGGWNQGGNWNQGGGYGYQGSYGGHDGYGQGYGGYGGGYGGYGGYGGDYYGYGQGGWGGYDQGYGYGSYDGGYGKTQKRGSHSGGGYHPYNR